MCICSRVSYLCVEKANETTVCLQLSPGNRICKYAPRHFFQHSSENFSFRDDFFFFSWSKCFCSHILTSPICWIYMAGANKHSSLTRTSMRLLILQLIIVSLFSIAEATTPRQFLSRTQGNGNFNKPVACKEAGDGIADDEDGRCQDLRFLAHELVNSGAPNALFAINQFYARLKSYFDKDKFYAQKFVAHTDDLTSDFDNLKTKARDKTWAEFNMAKFLFQVMIDSARYMDCYSGSNLFGHELVFWAVETYARAVAMFNIEGVIDRGIRNHTDRLDRIKHNLDALDYQFSILENTPFLIRLMFKDQWTRATRIVEVLQRQIDGTAKFVPES